jgi:CheY-like chemotaxis protein
MSKKRILIVDDNPSVLDMLRHSLARPGDDYQIFCTTGGASALSHLKEGSVDLLLTDYQMPGMNGLELARTTRRLAPGTRIVLMTAYADGDGLQERMRALALDGCLRKPFSLRQLREIVRDSLEGSC